MQLARCLALAITLAPSICFSADYSYVDVGDYYYINRFGENDYVRVQRKLGSGYVKVYDVNDGTSFTVQASKLLSGSQLQAEEDRNTMLGLGAAAGLLCILSESCGK